MPRVLNITTNREQLASDFRIFGNRIGLQNVRDVILCECYNIISLQQVGLGKEAAPMRL